MKIVRSYFVLAAAALLAMTAVTAEAQKTLQGKLSKNIYVQARAMGTGTQLGQTIGITVIIEELSTAADKAGLVEAFQAAGNEGLVNALSKMHAKGRMAIDGTLGYDVAYMRVFEQPDGSMMLRLITDRPIRFGEVWHDSRSRDYNLSAIEVTVKKDKKGKWKGEGTLLPACQLKMDKGELEIELRQNAWRLVNVDVRK